MSTQLQTDLIWQQSSGIVECHESCIVTTWPEYIRGVVIGYEHQRVDSGYTAYVEYFKYGIARQVWGGRVFTDCNQAKTWCAGEITRHWNP
jgi:hypothetical protein